jgi:hypothetical protein
MRFAMQQFEPKNRRMRRIFDRMDDTLIDGVFQPLADLCMSWGAAWNLPLDCFHLARFCGNVAALAWILSQAAGLSAAIRSGWLGLQVFQATLLLLGLGSIMVLQMLFQRDPGAGMANPLRDGMYLHRCCLLLGLAATLCRAAIGPGSPALLTVAAFATAAAYLAACSNQPPRWKSSDWDRRLVPLRVRSQG